MAIGTAYIKIMPEAKGISGEIAGITDPAAESAGKSGGAKWTAAFKKVMVTLGVGKLIGDTLMAGANLEQSIGGIETLYKGASDRMMQYASQAYKTAGVSANDYMQQATSFSAALIKSYNGDVNAAADATNKAMIAMADNANKMGTPMESIQMAYQGFAKQNYTMLDNLKLGYGGTKSEMERLLADANKINAEQGKITNYSIDNLGDVYEAIGVVQDSLGITGTTAKEAASTISGSIGMMKASWQDFMGNLTLGNDIYPQLEALAQSSVAVIKNVLPAIGSIITGIPKMIIGHWPEIKAAISSAVSKVATFMNEKWPAFRDAALRIIVRIGSTIIKNIPMFIGKVRQLVTKVVSWLQQNGGKVWGAVKKLIGVIIRNLPAILKSLFRLAVTLVKSGIKLAWSVAKGIFKTVLSGVKSFASGIISKLKSGLSKVGETMAKPFTSAKEKIDGIIEKIKGFFPIKFGKFFDNIKLPHFKVSGKFPYGLGGKGQVPGFSVDWYRKAENQPYMFNRATLFGAGERNDEILYGRKQLMEDISNATSGGQIVINLNYDAGTDAQEMVSDIARGLKRYRMAGVF